MARPREFDTDAVLQAAMELFWRRGYEATSIEDLLATMGISRGSLYKAFGDKAGVYRQAMARYLEREIGPMLAGLQRREQHGLERIADALAAPAAAVAADDRRGCLLCNVAVERPEVESIEAAVKDAFAQIDAAFATALEAAGHPTAQATAPLLTANYVGMRVLARAGYPADRLMDIAGRALATVQPAARTSTATSLRRRNGTVQGGS